MDYLDPKKKKAHKYRLMLGYSLFAVAIVFGTTLLAYMANGYYVDSSGEVIQNGLVFVDSKPGDADVFIDGEQQRGKTDMRLVIPGGKNYRFEIKRSGYRDWSRSLLIEEGTLRQLTYPRLIPTELEPNVALNLRSDPNSASQSINKRWLVLSYADEPLSLSLIDLQSASFEHRVLELPESITAIGAGGVFAVEEWANDNRFFLASYTLNGVVSYLIIDRENPSAAQNLNTVLGSKDFEISLQDRNRNRYFVYNKASQLLYTATLENGVNNTPVLNSEILEYKTFGNDWLIYAVESGEEGLIEIRFKRGDQDMELKKIRTAKQYFLELSKLGSAPVMALSSSEEDRATVYLDPQKFLAENPHAHIPVATTVLRVPGMQGLTISSDSSIVLAYGAVNMASHEFEADRSYNFPLEVPLDAKQELRWMDGQHLTLSSKGVQYVTDFDGSNLYDLVASPAALGSFFSDDVVGMFSFSASVKDAAGTITTPARLFVTSMLAPADR